MNAARRCGGTTRTGRPCRAWAQRGSNPPRCRAHANDNDRTGAGVIESGPVSFESGPVSFESGRLLTTATADQSRVSAQELAAFLAMPAASVLQDEIRLVRVILSRLLDEMQATPDLTVDQLAAFAPLVFAGTRTVSHLLRDQRALSSDVADGIIAAISMALDEMAADWEVEL